MRCYRLKDDGHYTLSDPYSSERSKIFRPQTLNPNLPGGEVEVGKLLRLLHHYLYEAEIFNATTITYGSFLDPRTQARGFLKSLSNHPLFRARFEELEDSILLSHFSTIPMIAPWNWMEESLETSPLMSFLRKEGILFVSLLSSFN